jgi:hypothetical protein
MDWRRDVIEFALDQETVQQMQEQVDWISREPQNPKPYYHLAQFYRMQWKPDEALGLLLEAVHLDPAYAEAHDALTEVYAVRADDAAAWRHARAAQAAGSSHGVDLLSRHGVAEPTGAEPS